MGTDIHAVWQKRNTPEEAWQDIPSNWEQDRHYQLFAVLADVRNGYGFAGVPTGQAVTPISEPRGLPEDFEHTDYEHKLPWNALSAEYQAWWAKYEHIKEGDPIDYWMGDHSFSWLSATEMLEWFKFAPSVIKQGIIDRPTYNKWDGKAAPAFYCGGVSGPDVVVTSADHLAVGQSPQNWTHIKVYWEEHLRLTLAYFFDEVQRLVDLHHPAEIRLVFGFDS